MSEGGPTSSLRAALALCARAPELFCFLDYDGTLAPIAPRPELAHPLPSIKATLERLSTAPGTSVAIVSGRRLPELRTLITLPSVSYVGLHGAEVLLPNGEIRRLDPPPGSAEALRVVREKLNGALSSLPGVWIEDKVWSVACHYRQAAQGTVQALSDVVRQIEAEIANSGAPLEVITGLCVWEFRPQGIHKGRAVRLLLDTIRPAALPLYAGDDRTDEDAFASLPEPAITIRVGDSNQPTLARFRVASPAELKTFLESLTAARLARK